LWWSFNMTATVAMAERNTTPMPDQSNQEGTMLGLPAESVQAWSNAAYIIAIAVAAALTFIIYQSSSIIVADKDRALEAYKSDAAARIAAAHTEAEQAKASAAEANSEAARANERAAVAISRAESAKADQARLAVDLEHEKVARAEFEAQFSWRVIDDDNNATLRREIELASHVVAIEYPSGDQEATFLALQFMNLFTDSGWKVVPRSVPAPQLFWGLDVPGPENDAVVLLRKALTAAGMQPVTQDIAIPGLFMGNDEANKLVPECRLIIGARMTASIQKLISDRNRQGPAPGR
jgi:hypothetical protein